MSPLDFHSAAMIASSVFPAVIHSYLSRAILNGEQTNSRSCTITFLNIYLESFAPSNLMRLLCIVRPAANQDLT